MTLKEELTAELKKLEGCSINDDEWRETVSRCSAIAQKHFKPLPFCIHAKGEPCVEDFEDRLCVTYTIDLRPPLQIKKLDCTGSVNCGCGSRSHGV